MFPGPPPIDDLEAYSPPEMLTTKYCLSIIQKALQDLGADCSDVVRVRLFVTDISRAQEFIQAHREFFAEHPPTSTMVEVSALVDPAMLVEVEAEAICFS